jgi:hypothetical protein
MTRAKERERERESEREREGVRERPERATSKVVCARVIRSADAQHETVANIAI